MCKCLSAQMENGKFHKFSFRKHGKTNQKARLKKKPTSKKNQQEKSKKKQRLHISHLEKMLGRDER